MKTKKLPTLGKLDKKLWAIFSLYIRNRDNWTCITCGRKGVGAQIHAGHAVPKKMCGKILKFHPMNVNAQCFVCNRYFDGAGIIYSINLRKKFGSNTDQILVDMIPESKAFKPTREWYNDKIELFKSAIDLDETMKEVEHDN